MRVTIVLHADLFEPWPILRAKREVDLLRRLGREVAVVSWIKDVSAPWPDRETRDGVQVRRVKLAPPKGMLSRALGYRRISKMFAGEVVASGADVVLCHDLEMLWASVLAGKRLGIPVLYHAHEDWPAMAAQRSRIEGWAFARLERRLLKHVAHVYTVNDAFAERYRARGNSATIIVGSKSLAEMPRLREEERKRIRAQFGVLPPDFVVGVAGALGTGLALGPMFEAVAPLPAHVKMFVVGGVPEKIEEARALVRAQNMENRVVFSGSLKTPEYLRYTATFDVGLAIYHPMSENLTGVVPLKLFDYMGLGIPTVISDFPAMRRIALEECGFALAADPDDPASIRKAIVQLIDHPEQRRAMTLSALRWFRDKYCGEKQEEILAASYPIFRAD